MRSSARISQTASEPSTVTRGRTGAVAANVLSMSLADASLFVGVGGARGVFDLRVGGVEAAVFAERRLGELDEGDVLIREAQDPLVEGADRHDVAAGERIARELAAERLLHIFAEVRPFGQEMKANPYVGLNA